MAESRIFKGENAPLLFGHRGCPQLAPENTLPSFNEILIHKVPGVELDVQICRSGELVVFHDNNMDRMTGHNGNVLDSDISLIRSLDCGSRFSKKFTGEKIPLFEEVLQLLGDKVYYDIELKSDYLKNRGLEKKVFEMLKDFNLENRVLISSFNPVSLMRIKRLSKDIPLSLIYSNTSEIPLLMRRGEGRFFQKNCSIKPDHRFLSKKLFQNLSRKYEVMTWTVDDEDLFKQFTQWDISGLCTNRADYFISREFVDQE